MRTPAQSFGARSSITNVIVALVLIAIPTAGVSVSAYAAPTSTPNTPARYRVLPAPADPPTNTPKPPPPPSSPAPPAAGNNGGDYYCGSCGSQGGGGGGG
jgi:hypothetical protein